MNYLKILIFKTSRCFSWGGISFPLIFTVDQLITLSIYAKL